MSRCDHCPATPGPTCPGECPRNRRHVCRLAAEGSPLARDIIAVRLGAECPPDRVPGAPPTGGADPAPPPATIDCIKKARECPHRDTTGGNCQYAFCRLGKGGMGGKVFLADCLACIAATPDGRSVGTVTTGG